MIDILIVIAPLFLIIFGSAVVQRVRHIEESWSVILNTFALQIGLPALIFSALAKTTFSLKDQGALIAVNSALIVSALVVAWIAGKMMRLRENMFRTVFLCLSYGNVAYLGIPTLTRAFGEGVLPETALIIALYNFWIFTLGLGLLDYDRQTKKSGVLKKVGVNLIKNPIMISVVAGIAVAGFNVPIPKIAVQAIDMLSASVVPLVLVVIGLFIGKSEMGKIKEWVPVFFFSVATLILLPAALYYGLPWFGLARQPFATSIIEAAMPFAITPFALADEWGLDKTFIARSIVLSTILSIVSLPFWISILN